VIEVHKQWAPYGAERFWRLVNLGFFDHSKIFRVKRGFVAQFGVSNDMQTNALFNNLPITDDPVKMSNRKGLISFAADVRDAANAGIHQSGRQQGPGQARLRAVREGVEGMNVVETFTRATARCRRAERARSEHAGGGRQRLRRVEIPVADGIHRATVVD